MIRGLRDGLLFTITLATAGQVRAQRVETEQRDSLAEALFRRLAPPGLSIAVEANFGEAEGLAFARVVLGR